MNPKHVYTLAGREMIYQRDGDKTTLTVACPFCGTLQAVTITAQQYYDCFVKGYYIQDVMPDLSAQQRETLITGICNNCWQEIAEDHD